MRRSIISVGFTSFVLAWAFVGVAAYSATFSAWEVSDVASDDVLNIRANPNSGSAVQAAYPNGTVLQMTGRCTGGIDLFDISVLPESRQRRLVRFRWCQVWHDPARDGVFTTGWAYGRYLRPAD